VEVGNIKRRILVIVPLYITEVDAIKIKNDLMRYKWDDTEIDVRGLKGNIAVNSSSEADIATPEFLKLVEEAKNEYDAIISYCYMDVGVTVAKELVNIPVVGPLEASAIIANMLGPKFSVITVGTVASSIEPRLRELGLDNNYVSTKNISFEEYFVFSTDPEKVKIMKNALIRNIEKALVDGASVIILGCTGLPTAEDLKEYFKVPIIDGTVALKVAEVLIDIRRSDKMISSLNEQKSETVKPPKIKIKLIIPTSKSPESQFMRELKKIVNKGTDIDVTSFKDGPESIKSGYDIAMVSPFIIREAVEAEKEGFNAIIISSFVDPALRSAREVCNIPVIGLGETSMLIACMLGKRFSIITYDKQVIPIIENIVRKIGIERKLVSIMTTSKEVWDEKEMYENIRKAIANGAEVVIVGGDIVQNPIPSIQTDIKVPIINPLVTALKMAEALCSLGLSHSKLAYPKPVLPTYHKERIKKLEEIPKDCMFLYSTIVNN